MCLTKEMLSALLSIPSLKHFNFENCPNLTDGDVPDRLFDISDERVYEMFLNGILVYRPCKDNDGIVVLRIAELDNALEGTFDLSGCGDTQNYLSISTGYRGLSNNGG